MCPAYRLTVDQQRECLVRIAQSAAIQPEIRVRRVAPSVLDSLYARAVRIGFFALPDTLLGDSTFCWRYATDLPGATVTIDTNAGKKSVDDYHGCAANITRGKREADRAAHI